MLTLKRILKDKLKGAKRIAILGIGSQLRGDDVAGMLVAKELEVYAGFINKHTPFKVFFGASAPENVTGQIKKFNPSHILIIDSAEMGEAAGRVSLISLESEVCSSFSTHRLPSRILVDYLTHSIGCEVIMLGIQPKSINFGETLSPEVEKGVKEFVVLVKDAII